MPTIQEALQRLERELIRARQQGLTILKIIHGYGSSGAGGDIRISVQRRLHEMQQDGRIRGCIFGEDWTRSSGESWKLISAHHDLKNDSDLGRRNQGITIVLL